MKKITFLLSVLFITNFLVAQNLTTGVISSPFPFGCSVKFDVNTATNEVTMTMVVPSNGWFGIALANDGIAINQGMGEANDDVIIGSSTGVEDRNMLGGTSTPPLDTSVNDWALISNTLAGGMRTIVATRNRVTGDIEDFDFPNSAGALPLLFAAKTTSPFTYHGNGSSRGFFMASLVEDVLSTNDLENTTINVYPNPVRTNLKINAHTQILDNLSVEVYNILGEKVFAKSLNKYDAQISVSNWNDGLYIIKIMSSKNDEILIKRFIKI